MYRLAVYSVSFHLTVGQHKIIRTIAQVAVQNKALYTGTSACSTPHIYEERLP